MNLNLPINITNEICLRALQQSDATSIAKNANNKAIWDCVRDYFPHPYTIDHAKSFIHLNTQNTPYEKLAICLNNNAIGIIGINPQADTERNSVELGYWLGVDYWGKGILSSCLPKALEYFWTTQPHINRIFASVHHNNPASIKLLEANKFEYEGCLKQAIFKNSMYLNELRYGLLKK
jgi:RimJ/RimL family protein N-acetyltransferase